MQDSDTNEDEKKVEKGNAEWERERERGKGQSPMKNKTHTKKHTKEEKEKWDIKNTIYINFDSVKYFNMKFKSRINPTNIYASGRHWNEFRIYFAYNA